MSTAQRSFVQKMSKQPAADVRKNISVHMQSKTTSCTSMCSSTLSLTEPLDYEEFLIQHMNIINRDPLKHILDFPQGDVSIKTIPRKIRTIDHIIPNENISELPKHVQESIRCYTRPWKVVEYAHRHYSSSSCARERIDRDTTSPSAYQQEFEIDKDFSSFDESFTDKSESCTPSSRQSIASLASVSSCTDTLTPRSSWASFDLRRSVNDPLIPNLLDNVPPDQIDQLNEMRRQEDRQGAFFSLYPEIEGEDAIERRLLAELPVEHIGHRIHVKCLQLRLELEVEPIFASMAIYDAKERQKVSENFYFDMNSDSLKLMLSTHVRCADVSTQSRSAIFEISYPSNDLFLVIRLEKVLQGDINNSVEPYLKEDKEKYREKVKSNAMDYCERLGKYRMPFAWTAIYLTNVFNGDNFENKDSCAGDRDSSNNGSAVLGSAASSNSLDRKSSTSSFDQLRRKANDMSGTLTRRGSLERKEKRRSWSPDDFANVVENFRPITLTVPNFFKQEPDKMKDDDLYKILPELKRPSTVMKKYKCIPGSIKLEISPCVEDVTNALTPELAKIEPHSGDNTRPIKEILEFPLLPIYNPYYSYRNLLFVSPKELNFSSRAGSARNIAIRIQLMSGETQADAVNAIFGKSSCPEFATDVFTCVNYHNKCPSFYDEIKIALPASIKEHHHLLFTIYHVSCQKKPHELQLPVETPIGYTWLPLLEDGKLRVGEFNLPVMVEAPPKNYSFIPPNVHLPGIKWLDNHRAVFSINIAAVTSVHTLDAHLDRFFLICEYIDTRNIPSHIGEGNMEAELKKCLLDIEHANRESLVKHLPLVLDKLIELLVTTHKVGGQTLCLSSTVFEVLCLVSAHLSVLSDVDQYGRQSLFSTYVQFQCKIPHPLMTKRNTARYPANEFLSKESYDIYDALSTDAADLQSEAQLESDMTIRLLHEELALQYTLSSGKTADLAMTNSWFLFELIVKSMIEHLDNSGTLNAPRKHRFPQQFNDDIASLVDIVTNKVMEYHSTDPRLAQSLNASLSFLIFDLLSIMDRGFVFGLIQIYSKRIISASASGPELMNYKIDFHRIVCSHEHFVALNFPFGTSYTTFSAPCSPTPSTTSSTSQTSYGSIERSLHADLSSEFRQQHFLVGIVLSDLATIMEIPNPQLHGKAINCIRNLLTSHDSRYDAEVRSRVASLYIPLLSIVMDTFSQLHQYLSDAQDHDRLQQMGQLEDYQGPHQIIAKATISPEVAYAISGSRVYSYMTEPSKSKVPLNAENTRHLLACFLWVLKNLERTVLYRWLLGLSPHRVHQMLQVLNTCLKAFEYSGQKRLPSLKRTNTHSFRKSAPTDVKEKLEECIRGTNSARYDLINRRKDRNSTEKLRWRKDHMPYRSQYSESSNKNETELEMSHFIEGSLSTEIALIILDSLEIIVHVATNLHHNLLGTVLKVLLHSLSRNQSTLALQNLFASQRALIFKFPNLLFDEETDICADLCLLLLKHCASQLPGIRSQAAASLYLLMRQNFEIGNNFARVKMQVTMSLSSLVGTSASFSEQSLRRALKTVLVYAESDTDLQETSFPEQVQDLLFNLHMILSDTVKMKEYQEDPEMLLDLMNRIAKGYQNNPDLRLTWLENMAKKHRERANHTEAAMCYIHGAALVSEYLSMLESQTHLPIGAVSFQRISPNTFMESAVSDDVLSPGEDGICLGNHFTETGLKALLEEASNSFQVAGMYEAMNEVYKILLPICEANREFHKLGKIHGKLQEAFNRIAQLHGKRVFGTYFRVGFYGAKFGDLDQQEFIYKEPTLTKLPEIFTRLQNFYTERFGPDSVHIIKDSNNFDPNTLDPEKAYIFFSYVEPFFETYEMRHRETYFERNFNIKRFIFSFFFTKSGKAHGELHEQCKRKTILTTANHFPYVKTRIQVINIFLFQLEPIEVAIEDIQKKTLELAAATNQEPADPKILQMVLQGCIGTTVNQGPMEMASVFLSNFFYGTTIPTKHQNKLRLCFREFSKRCADALKKNRNLILSDQKDYQRELERNYERFVERLMPLITLSSAQTQGVVKANAFQNKSTPLKCVSDYFK
ncbi:PREDICTED: dedicator of cytokinesis protein 7 [Drosophila arizonae]|uniref:Dedicator of cytokinesis protein 7 n=1 Tax=Drosophila arizonae TaxID=7263 RepID=A0ABM1NXV4_DROAR|nr:PREDICTED: dedicator of cytokinesis protein 7 [Drosophila arizonae]